MARGLMVTTLAGDGAAAKPLVGGNAAKKPGFSFGAKVTQDDVTIMTRQLATLIVAGLPLLRALELIHKQERNPAFKNILGNIAEGIAQVVPESQRPKVLKFYQDNKKENKNRVTSKTGVVELG